MTRKRRTAADRLAAFEAENATLRAELERAQGVNSELLDLMTTHDQDRGQGWARKMIELAGGDMGIMSARLNTRGQPVMIEHVLGDFVSTAFHDEWLRLATYVNVTQGVIHALYHLAPPARRRSSEHLRKLEGIMADVRQQWLSFLATEFQIPEDDPHIVRARGRFDDYIAALREAQTGNEARLAELAADPYFDLTELLTAIAASGRGGRKPNAALRWVGEQLREMKTEGVTGYDDQVRELRARAQTIRDDWRSEIARRLEGWNPYAADKKHDIREWLRYCEKLDAEK